MEGQLGDSIQQSLVILFCCFRRKRLRLGFPYVSLKHVCRMGRWLNLNMSLLVISKQEKDSNMYSGLYTSLKLGLKSQRQHN
ncbi:hypothetical protein L1987_08104 [Smallanthus sonchifolius]|uniref:Uncharacterized protein n=1 Tax=Smallanthus sonchifolius TaxID=185202 RepID=A0ACB9JLF5_9ASTR|nr:hypothetical protein L1987_08104 [Smallanthus sonchifolius]